jgi:5-methylcytosine-specific restriction endonuclease McrA
MAIVPKESQWDERTPFYHTNKWRKKSEYIRNNEPYCRVCKEKGITIIGKVADHIIPMSKGGDPWADENLQTLCNVCHNKKRKEESLGKIGKWKMNEDGYKVPDG